MILNCCAVEQSNPYIGIDAICQKNAIFCINHSPHLNKEGLLHQMMPLAHFKRLINEKKYKMQDKVTNLIDGYLEFMDKLIQQINQIKLSKSIQIKLLWLREISSSQHQYQQLKRICRNDFQNITCAQAHSLYFKIIQHHNFQMQPLHQIPVYKQLHKSIEIMINNSKLSKIIAQKVTFLQGIVQKGELLKKALPDRKILRDHKKQTLLQTISSFFQVKYNKAQIKTSCKNYQSIFSKYPIINNIDYRIAVNSKYGNILIGICLGKLKKKKQSDLHYNMYSMVFNCGNGCLYRDGMFKSGSCQFTKGLKYFELNIKITSNQFIILSEKNVVCREQMGDFIGKNIYLHVLMRSKGDYIEIDSDNFLISQQNLDENDQQSEKQPQLVQEQQQQINQYFSLGKPMVPSLNRDRTISFKKAQFNNQQQDIIKSFNQKKQKQSSIIQAQIIHSEDLQKQNDKKLFSYSIQKTQLKQQFKINLIDSNNSNKYNLKQSIPLYPVDKDTSKIQIYQISNSLTSKQSVPLSRSGRENTSRYQNESQPIYSDASSQQLPHFQTKNQNLMSPAKLFPSLMNYPISSKNTSQQQYEQIQQIQQIQSSDLIKR